MKIESNIRQILNEHFPGLAIVIDVDGNIKSLDAEAQKNMPRAREGENLFKIIEVQSSDLLERLFIESKEYQRVIKDYLTLKLGGIEKNYDVVFSVLSDGDYLFTANPSGSSRESKQLVRFNLSTEKIENISKSKKMLEIINLVKASYPFTFIGKNNLLKAVDGLDSFFWIKEARGKYSVVNEKLAGAIGLARPQIEGRDDTEFLPQYLQEINRKILGLIRETSNTIIHTGIFNIFSNADVPLETVEFPIIDIDGNVVAIIGFTQPVSGESSGKTRTDNLFESSLFRIPEAILLFDENKNVVSCNEKFSELFQIRNAKEITGKPITGIFELEINKKIDEFIQSEKETVSFTYELKEENLFFNLRKISDEADSILGYGIYCQVNASIDPQINDKVKMYDLIMEASPEAMFIYDVENLKFLEVNKAALKLYGYSRTAFLQMDLTDLYAPEDIQTLLQSKAVTEDKKFSGPWRHKKKDGSSVLVEISRSAVMFKERKAHINIVRDVDIKMQADKQMQMLQASFENTSDLIIRTDKDGFINFTNDSVARELGYSKMELEERTFPSLLTDKERGRVNSLVFQADLTQAINFELELKKSGGGIVKGTLTATPIKNYLGEIDEFVLVINVKKEIEKIIEIEKEVPSIDAKKTTPATGIDADFLSNVFHEILTPINVIIGFGQELSESIDEPDAEQKEAQDIIKENQKMLMGIMDTVSEYTSLETNRVKIQPEEITFVDIVDDIFDSTKKLSASTGVELTYGKISSSLKLETDKNKFTTLLVEFAKIALQFTKKDKIFLSAYMFDNKNCVVSVKDESSSISPEMLTAIKDFFRMTENDIRRNFGISRFTSRLFKKLLSVLGAQGDEIIRAGETVEYGLLFPVEFSGIIPEDLPVEDKFDAKEISRAGQISPGIDQMSATGTASRPEEPLFEDGLRETAFEEAPKEFREDKSFSGEPVKANNTYKDSQVVQVNVAMPQQPPVQQAPPKDPDELDFKNLTCIYVEDQIDSQILFKVQMKDLKALEFATSLETALPLIKSRQFDFVVLDMNLQGEYNGLDALRIIRKIPGYESLPIVAATAYVLPGDREKFIAAGFSDFMSKPVMREKLTDCLKNIYSTMAK